jgi:hypothetical protein
MLVPGLTRTLFVTIYGVSSVQYFYKHLIKRPTAGNDTCY